MQGTRSTNTVGNTPPPKGGRVTGLVGSGVGEGGGVSGAGVLGAGVGEEGGVPEARVMGSEWGKCADKNRAGAGAGAQARAGAKGMLDCRATEGERGFEPHLLE